MRTAEKVTRQCACDTLVSTRREKHVKKQGRRKKLKIERGKKKNTPCWNRNLIAPKDPFAPLWILIEEPHSMSGFEY